MSDAKPTGTDLVNVSLRLPRDLLAQIDARAAQIDGAVRNRSSVVRQALRRQMAAEGEPQLPKEVEVVA